MRSIIHLNSFIICLLIFTGCSSVSAPDLVFIEGYWEIESVHAHGEVFEPKGATPMIDFYQLNSEKSGFKKKMKPIFNGLFQSSEDRVTFIIQKEGNRFFIHFNNALTPWKEEIRSLSPEEMILFHNDKAYHYKRYQKIAL